MNKKVDILTPYHPNYHGGGPEALIDGVRGSKNWRLGGWQGYQGTDFKAIIDLGKSQPIHYLAAGFVQEIRSWIWMPKDVTFYVSDDGESFTQVLHVENTIPYDDYELYHEDLGGRVNTRGSM